LFIIHTLQSSAIIEQRAIYAAGFNFDGQKRAKYAGRTPLALKKSRIFFEKSSKMYLRVCLDF
jgi:hypothetical protein